MKKILFLIVAGIAMLQISNAQDIAIKGAAGVLGQDNVTITFGEFSNINKVVVEAMAFIVTNSNTPPTGLVKFNGSTAAFNYVEVNKSLGSNPWLYTYGPNKDKYSHKGYYSRTFKKTEIVDGVKLNKNGVDMIMSYYAYVYYEDGDVNTYCITEATPKRGFVHLNGSSNPVVYNFTLDAIVGTRDIELKMPFSDNETEEVRYVSVTLFGNGNKSNQEFRLNKEGDNLWFQTLTLSDVAGDVTDISVEVYSQNPQVPDNDEVKGDSFWMGMPVICVTDRPEEDCAECIGGITELELQYTGSPADSISIYKGKVDEKNLLEKFLNVENGEFLNIVGNRKNNTMGAKILIAVSGSNKYTEIHTSCSQPIYSGMTFGDFLIVSGTSKDGGPLCPGPGDNGDCGECKGGITELELLYTGSATDKIGVYTGKVDKKNELFTGIPTNGSIEFVGNGKNGTMGAKIIITINGRKYTEIHTSCSQDIYTGMKFGDGKLLEIVSGTSKDGGPLCPGSEDNGACECEGGVTELELVYNKGEVGNLTVTNKNGVLDTDTYTNNDDETILIISNNGEKLGTYIYITDGTITTPLHTSCSQPIYATMTFGGVGDDDFTIVDGTSKDGGKLCDEPYDKNKKKSAMIENNETIAETLEFGVYPNPVRNVSAIFFKPVTSGRVTVDLYNSVGQRMSRLMDKNVPEGIPVNLSINGQDYNEGLYILRMQNEDGISTLKIQIAR